MVKHPLRVSGYTSMEDFAEYTNNLRYDALCDFLISFGSAMKNSAAKDLTRGREKLSDSLDAASDNLLDAAKHIAIAWQISEPYMREDTPAKVLGDVFRATGFPRGTNEGR